MPEKRRQHAEWTPERLQLEKLLTLKLSGMYEALNEQLNSPDIEQMSFDEWLGLMVDREITVRDNRRLKTRLKNARLRQYACMEDIDFRHPRGLKVNGTDLSLKAPQTILSYLFLCALRVLCGSNSRPATRKEAEELMRWE